MGKVIDMTTLPLKNDPHIGTKAADFALWPKSEIRKLLEMTIAERDAWRQRALNAEEELWARAKKRNGE